MAELADNPTDSETSRSTAPEAVCDYCETIFKPRILHGQNSSRFCSDHCRAAWHKENKAEAIAVIGTRRKMKEMADGTLRVEVDIDPQYRQRFLSQFQEIDVPVGLIRLNIDVTGKPKPQPPSKPYGQQAKELKLSGFFRAQSVWWVLGSDDDYKEWVKHQPSAWSGEFSEYLDNGEGRSIPAHVRRISTGTGTGIKNEYAVIPLTKSEHDLQHLRGESIFNKGKETGKEWMDRMRIKYVETWAWEQLRKELQVESMGDAEPKWVLAWAQRNGVEHLLPEVYRNA